MPGLARNKRGDTIIEVMIALALLGLAFGIAYATANHSLQVSQNSQEHTQALQVLRSQVEMARAESDNSDLYVSGEKQFCLASNGAGKIHIVQYAGSTPETCMSPVNSGVNYDLSVVYYPNKDGDVSQDIFVFTVQWDGIGTLGRQQEQISYKLHDLSS